MRPMDQITAKEQKHHVILHYLMNQEMKAYWNGQVQSMTVTQELPGGEEIIVDWSEVWPIGPGSNLVLSKLLARYLELHCTFVKQITPNKIQLHVDKVLIAKKERLNPRFTISEDGLVNVTNIVSSKTIIEANMFNIPTLVRVNFEDYRKRMMVRSGEAGAMDIFKSGMERKYEVVKSTQKILFIKDASNPESYRSDEEGFINYEDEVDDHVEKLAMASKDKKIKSELILPILYKNELEEIIPIGYYSLQTKDNAITTEDLNFYQAQIAEMIERIKDANLMTTVEKFPVLDLSATGLKIRITNSNLVETLPKQKGILLELVFKLQTPFRFFGKIAWAYKETSGDLLVGIEFSGKRTYAEKVRFEENIEIIKNNGKTAA
ncbi:DUF1577 domain-containing protein [Leptospira congkakensis]|uniref:DUF1577 domain-containing protein n=1 Tax=Leptospira congkakensis TaxID=2484932 RepID=A0A4Z1AJI6_9LEPT|nr:DUF1577 domain-containing protein [Leptospira congkakensis]TGL88728.1 DUF1577 domain-containing protein [Leptospira congkakensis]TGL89314.1 DUF1577 domain-containing protein [Leptospira congkakensis]TGL97282.1 DUF1577 domain-containing protein [Leptospira congkakensis]